MTNPGSNNNFRNQGVGSLRADDEDDETYDHYSTAGLVELRSNDFPDYFIERDDRLFHSHGNALYPLPVDTPEQQRLNVEHTALHQLIGANYIGPVPQVLEADSRQKLVLDVGNGTGQWLLEMASEFPHVQFRGIDIVPIATRYPPKNVQIEMHDINQQFRWNDNMIDFVHIRNMWMTTRNYPNIINEIARVLRPGGLLLCCEWGFYPSLHPVYRTDPSVQAPGAYRFFDIVTQSLILLGIRPVANAIPDWLARSSQFDEITPQLYYMPIGPWHQDPGLQRIGKAFRAACKRLPDALRPMLIRAGWNETVLDQVFMDYFHDLQTVKGMVCVYHTVHARKKRL